MRTTGSFLAITAAWIHPGCVGSASTPPATRSPIASPSVTQFCDERESPAADPPLAGQARERAGSADLSLAGLSAVFLHRVVLSPGEWTRAGPGPADGVGVRGALFQCLPATRFEGNGARRRHGRSLGGMESVQQR